MKRTMIALVVAGFGVFTVEAALFDFNDGTPLDNVGIGATMTADSISITTVDIQGWDGSLASTGSVHKTNVSGTSNALGVNSETTPPTTSGTNDPRDFDPGEAWIFSFDTDVYLSEIDLASLDLDAQLTISSSEFAPIVINDDGGSADIYSLGNTFVSAGTLIKFENTAPAAAGNEWRISTLTVIPEPAAVSMLGLGAGAILMFRRLRKVR